MSKCITSPKGAKGSSKGLNKAGRALLDSFEKTRAAIEMIGFPPGCPGLPAAKDMEYREANGTAHRGWLDGYLYANLPDGWSFVFFHGDKWCWDTNNTLGTHFDFEYVHRNHGHYGLVRTNDRSGWPEITPGEAKRIIREDRQRSRAPLPTPNMTLAQQFRCLVGRADEADRHGIIGAITVVALREWKPSHQQLVSVFKRLPRDQQRDMVQIVAKRQAPEAAIVKPAPAPIASATSPTVSNKPPHGTLRAYVRSLELVVPPQLAPQAQAKIEARLLAKIPLAIRRAFLPAFLEAAKLSQVERRQFEPMILPHLA